MDDSSWHLDKKVPLGLVLGLAINALCGIWYASKLDSRVAVLELQAMVLTNDTLKLKDSSDGGKERLIRVEDKLENILEALRKMESRMTPYLPPNLRQTM